MTVVFGIVFRFYWDLVVRMYQVNLAEDLGSTEGCSEVMDIGKGVMVGYGMVIQ